MSRLGDDGGEMSDYVESADVAAASAASSYLRMTLTGQLGTMGIDDAQALIGQASSRPGAVAAMVGLPAEPDQASVDEALFFLYSDAKAAHDASVYASLSEREERIARAALDHRIFQNAGMSDDEVARARVNESMGDRLDVIRARDAYYFR